MALSLLTIAESGAAQEAARIPAGPVVAFARFEPALPDAAPAGELAGLNADLRRATQATHWLTGGILGGAVLGAGGIALAAGLCNSDSGTDSCTWPIIGSGLVGAGVGFALGALIGGQIPKGEAASAAP